MEYRILGPLVVLSGDRQLALGPLKDRTVLGVLLLHANEVVPRQRLIDELWGESPPPTAVKAVNVYVSQLRKTLGAAASGPIATRAPGYVIDVRRGELDAERFGVLTGEARARAGDGAFEEAAALYGEALSLWRGRALSGIELESVGRHELDRLDETRTVALMDRIDCELTIGRHDDLIGELEVLIAEDPLRERLYGQLMLALYRSGRQADALRVYQRARTALVEQLGLEPGPELRQLELAILKHDPSLVEVPRRMPPAPANRRFGRASSPRRRRTLLVLGVAAVIGSVAAIAAVALRGDSDQAGAVSVPDHAAVAIDPTSGRVTATVPLGGQPVAALADGDSIWIANSTNRTLTRISDRTGTPTATIGLPAEPTGLALGAGRLWLASFDHRHSLTAVDPRSGDIQFSIPLRQPGLGRFAAEGRGANAVAFANRSVWVTVGVSGLLRLSPRGTVLHSFVVGPNATAVTAGAGSIWVALLGPAQIVEVDPLHNQVGQATNVGNMDRGSELWDALQCTIAATGASVWVPAYGGGGGGGVWRIDTIGHSVTAVIQTGGSPCDVAARDDEVWVTNPNNRELDEIDPTTDSVTRKITLTETPGAIAATGRHIWVTTN